MHMALHWTHDNIGAFGGDKNDVTIFGNSAGGAAVLFLATQPLNKGLFQRVIAQSGSFFGLWTYQLNRDSYNSLAFNTGCSNRTSSEALDCLRSVPVYVLKGQYPSAFVPTIDREFIKQSPMELLYSDITIDALKSLTFLSELDLIVGTNTNDGAYSESTWSSNMPCDSLAEYLKEMFIWQGCTGYRSSDYKHLLWAFPCDDLEQIWRKLNTTDPSIIYSYRNYDVTKLLIEILRDFMLFVPAVLSAKLHNLSTKKRNDNGNLYFYIFDQRPSYAGSPDWLLGATHFMEIPYIFGLPESFQEKLELDFGASYPNDISKSDVHLAQAMMKLKSNFAKTGNPNSGDQKEENVLQPQWPLYTEESRLYLNIEVNQTEQRRLEDYPPTKKISTITEVLRNTDIQCMLIMNSSSFVTSVYTSLFLS